MPSGRLCAECAANATAWMAIVRSGDPFTVNVPSANSRSSSETSSWWATMLRAFAITFCAAWYRARCRRPRATRLPYVSMP